MSITPVGQPPAEIQKHADRLRNLSDAIVAPYASKLVIEATFKAIMTSLALAKSKLPLVADSDTRKSINALIEEAYREADAVVNKAKDVLGLILKKEIEL